MEPNLFRYVWEKSRAEQIFVLFIILASIPFNWISLELPKRIVNDAIQGKAFQSGNATARLFHFTVQLPDLLGGHSLVISEGIELGQKGYLLALSASFLFFVLINGGFKYVINLRKGILGERMLRRMRYDLFAQLMRFRPEDMRAAKPAEVASMIKDEVEPIGGFVGDAFIQPVFLLSQALTALVFIMAQSVWLGSIALAIVLVQAVIIPILRREQLRLGRERQIASRYLAGRIGEIVDAGPTIQGHGAAAYVQSDIAGRLGNLFDIRYALYKRKFAVKFLNNLLAQITPFFFYAIGGWFALQGQLNIGQLVAVIAAYRDLPPPVKELIDWDQQRNDVTIKYEQVIAQFNPSETLTLEDGDAELGEPAHEGELKLESVQMFDNRGHQILAPFSLVLKRPGVLALVGAPGGGRDVLGRILGRQITTYAGRVSIDGVDYQRLSVARASQLIGYSGPDSEIINGTLRDNILLSLKRHKPKLETERSLDAEEHRRIIEALRSGNTPLSFDDDWTDYRAAGLDSPAGLEAHIRRVLDTLGCAQDVYELGLDGKLSAPLEEDVAASIVEARRAVARELSDPRHKGLVESFDPNRYNANATIGENLIFGTPKSPRFGNAALLDDPYANSVLQAEALIEPLAEIGGRIVATLAEIFEGLPPGHALFERYSFGKVLDMEALRTLADVLAKHDIRYPLDPAVERDVVEFALGYIEPKHRLNLIDGAFRRRVLRARKTFRAFLPADAVDDLEFYEANAILFGASVRDNLLFGRIGFGVADAGRKVAEIVRTALSRAGLEGELYGLGLGTDVGIRGRFLPARLRAAVPLAQALIKCPEIYVLDPGALLGATERPEDLVAQLRDYCAGRTLVLLLPDAALASDIEQVIIFDGPVGRPPEVEAEAESDGEAGIPERLPVRANGAAVGREAAT